MPLHRWQAKTVGIVSSAAPPQVKTVCQVITTRMCLKRGAIRLRRTFLSCSVLPLIFLHLRTLLRLEQRRKCRFPVIANLMASKTSEACFPQQYESQGALRDFPEASSETWDWHRRSGADPRDPRCSGPPCHGHHLRLGRRGNQHANYYHCIECGLRILYIPKHGKSGKYRRAGPLPADKGADLASKEPMPLEVPGMAQPKATQVISWGKPGKSKGKGLPRVELPSSSAACAARLDSLAQTPKMTGEKNESETKVLLEQVVHGMRHLQERLGALEAQAKPSGEPVLSTENDKTWTAVHLPDQDAPQEVNWGDDDISLDSRSAVSGSTKR